MKKLLSLSLATALAVVFVSCSKEDHVNLQESDVSLETRAIALGYADVNSYMVGVEQQCAIGNHANCDVLYNGTHQACSHAEHSGIRHDGARHNGSGQGNHGHNNNNYQHHE